MILEKGGKYNGQGFIVFIVTSDNDTNKCTLSRIPDI